MIILQSLTKFTVNLTKKPTHKRNLFHKNEVVSKNPHIIFNQWYNEVNQIYDAKYTCLTTVSQSGSPSCKAIRLIDFSEDGFTFTLNKGSETELQLKSNVHVALTFLWPLYKMVRVEGKVIELLTEAYDTQISYNDRIAAECRKTGYLFQSHCTLHQYVNKLKAQYPPQSKLVPNISVYIAMVDRIEFYQNKKGQLQERLQFNKNMTVDNKLIYQADNNWTYSILSP